MIMKKLVIMTALAFSGIAFAQPQHHSGPRGEHRYEQRDRDGDSRRDNRAQKRELAQIEHDLVEKKRFLDNYARQHRVDRGESRRVNAEYDRLITKTRFLNTRQSVSWGDIDNLKRDVRRLEYRNIHNRRDYR